MKKNTLIIILILALCFLAFSKKQKPTETPVPSTPVEQPTTAEPEVKAFELKKQSFEDLANWKKDDLRSLIEAFRLSCMKIKFEKNDFLSNSLAQIPTKDYQRICTYFEQEKISSSKEFKNFIEDHFNPHLVLAKGSSTGKFTSYYEAAIKASKNKSDVYKYPIYGRPNDLIEFNPKDFDETAASKRYLGRIKGTKLVPYYTREEIESAAFQAPVLLWGDNLVDIHVMHIQGSAVAKLNTGENIRIGYADNNGHKFRGIGSILLEKGLIKPGQANMGSIKKWLCENLEQAKKTMYENKRFVFFRTIENNSFGPIGAEGVPLTPSRSLAVDRSFIPLGSLLWLETTGPNKEKIEKLTIAQDVGSAIVGAIRGDYFWGSGGDDVLELAGKMNSEGRYFIMLPKSMEVE